MTANSLSDALHEAYVQARDMDASLGERLQAFADAVRRLGPHFQEAVDKPRRAAERAGRRRDRAEARRAHAALRSARRDRPPRQPRHASRQGAGRHHLPSRILVPLLPHQHACARRGARRDRGGGRTDRRHHARPAAFHRRAQGRARRALPDPHRHRQRLRDVVEPRLLGRRRDAEADDRRGLGRVAFARKQHLAACRSPQPSWSAPTAR